MPSMHRLAYSSLPTPPPRQLALPLDPPEALPTATPPAAAITLRTQPVWATLSPTAQAQLRQTRLRSLQEVVHVAAEA